MHMGNICRRVEIEDRDYIKHEGGGEVIMLSSLNFIWPDKRGPHGGVGRPEAGTYTKKNG